MAKYIERGIVTTIVTFKTPDGTEHTEALKGRVNKNKIAKRIIALEKYSADGIIVKSVTKSVKKYRMLESDFIKSAELLEDNDNNEEGVE